MATEISIEDSTLKPLLDKSQNIQIEQILPWKQQLTLRGLLISAVLGTLFSLMVHRLNLTVGVVPSLGAPAALLAFYIIRLWNQVMSKLRLPVSPLTRQENTVIQTCIVACFGVAYSGKILLLCYSAISSFWVCFLIFFPLQKISFFFFFLLGWCYGIILHCYDLRFYFIWLRTKKNKNSRIPSKGLDAS